MALPLLADHVWILNVRQYGISSCIHPLHLVELDIALYFKQAVLPRLLSICCTWLHPSITARSIALGRASVVLWRMWLSCINAWRHWDVWIAVYLTWGCLMQSKCNIWKSAVWSMMYMTCSWVVELTPINGSEVRLLSCESLFGRFVLDPWGSLCLLHPVMCC